MPIAADPVATLVFFMLVFTAIGAFFLFIHLVAGSFVRPYKPDAEKLTIYECGEPTVGSAWVQFDLRYYVVALLFVIFDVEVAFFFPWATVFGTANQLANLPEPPAKKAVAEYSSDEKKIEADRRRLSGQLLPAGVSAKFMRDQKLVTHDLRWKYVNAKGESIANAHEGSVDRFEVRDAAGKGVKGSKVAKVDGKDVPVNAKGKQIANATVVKAGERRAILDANGVEIVGARKVPEESHADVAAAIPPATAAGWARVAFGDILVFFGVLLVGFAYVWRRGDINWIRSYDQHEELPAEPEKTLEQPAHLPPPPPAPVAAHH